MGKYYILLILSFFSLSILAQNVTNVRGSQEGQNIVLLYDLQADTRISQVYVEIDGKSRLVPNSCLSGDVNKIVAKGQNRRIVYDVLADYTNGLKADRIAFVINPESSGTHEYVDLGLSVKWATCNVGASKPEEYGDYFAWGETKPKNSYSSSNYSYKGNPVTLPMSADAARANWGGSWRMPTKAEQDELQSNCTWTWTTQNGVKGYKVTSKSNGNSIFIPAAGYRYDSSLSNAGSRGRYWSSSLNTYDPSLAWYVYFDSSGVYRSNGYRHYGFSVRPVCQ